VCARKDGIRRSKDLRAEIGKFPNSTNERKKMSIKTIKQRIAVATVSVLAAGVLSVIATPSANADWAAPVAAANAGVQGTSTPCLAGSLTAVAPRYHAVGAKQGFDIPSGATNTATSVITGPAKWVSNTVTADGLPQSTISSDNKKITHTGSAAGFAILEFTGVGQVVVTNYDHDSAGRSTLYFIAVASCDASVSLGDSLAQLRDDTGAADSNVNESGGSTVAYNAAGQKSYLALDLNDAYGIAVNTTSLALIATTTGGCTINWDASAASGTTTAVDTGAGNADENLVILGDNTPRSCTVTVTLGTTTVATKTVLFTGDAATLAIVPSSTSSYWTWSNAGNGAAGEANVDAIAYITKDSAGNTINSGGTPSLSDGTGSQQQTTVSAGTYASTSMRTNGLATLDVSTGSSSSSLGAGTYRLKLTRASDGQSIYSAVTTANNSSASYFTYEVSWDKASYSVGDIMTMSVTLKDSGGRLAPDNTQVGAGVAIVVNGATEATAETSTDKTTNGAKKYYFSAGTTAAAYGYSVLLPANGSGQGVVTGTYTIKDPNSGTSNADVLKSIVALIASINKQIQALQKLILKR
jgi:trimeric autotransporter adhesin